MSQEDNFRALLETVVQQNIDGCVALISVERLSGGASQETYRLRIKKGNGEEKLLALRRAAGGEFQERAPQHPGLDVEALLMTSARSAGVPEPEVYYVLQRHDALGDGFLMEWLEGETLGARIVKLPEFSKVRKGLAYECGKVLAKIHAIDLETTGLKNRLWEISPKEFVEQTWERYKLLETPHPMIDFTARWLLENLPENYVHTLVHNDFRNGNFMLSSSGIVAVLDWEVAHIGDPMRDLGWICTNSWRFGQELPVGGFGDYEDLFRGYEEESGFKVNPDHVKFWEVFGSFWWAVGCLGMAEHYRSGPDKTVERPIIGRRSSECQIDCVNLLIPGPVEILEHEESISSLDLPRSDELLMSVRDFLRDSVMKTSEGRDKFLARVAANSLDIVNRELALAPRHLQGELKRLREMFSSNQDLGALRERLVKSLRDRTLSLENEDLRVHLRTTVVNQTAIDQPNYSGLTRAIKAGLA